MLKKIKSPLLLVVLLSSLFLLSGCTSGDNIISDTFTAIGKTFEWFFIKFTPAYFSSLKGIWSILPVVKECWNVPTVMGYIIGITTSIFLIAIILIITAIIIAGYIILFVLFLALFIVLILLSLIGALIAFISWWIISN